MDGRVEKRKEERGWVGGGEGRGGHAEWKEYYYWCLRTQKLAEVMNRFLVLVWISGF